MSKLIDAQEQSQAAYYFARCNMPGVDRAADRLSEAMRRRGVSQSALARRIGTTQGAISLILRGKTANSRLLPKIALQLNVPLPWLMGVTDDAEADDLSDCRTEVQQIMMPVSLPSEKALALMFEGLLLAVDLTQPAGELARELAQLLPTALTQVQQPLYELPVPPRSMTSLTAEGLEAHAIGDPERQR